MDLFWNTNDLLLEPKPRVNYSIYARVYKSQWNTAEHENNGG